MPKNKVICQNPPIVEVVLGVQFEGKQISFNDIANYYSQNQIDYTEIQEHPILPAVIEDTENQNNIQLLNGFHTRKFFLHKDKTRLIQIQPDRLLFNWRKKDSDNVYPHFESVFDEFYNKLLNFYKINNCVDKVNQYEITYVDHILLEDFDLTNFDLTKIFNFFSFTKSLKNIDLNFTIPYKELNGNLYLKFRSGQRNKDKKKIIISEYTFRGFVSKDKMVLKDWFNNAHNIIIDNFCEIISSEAKTKWKCNL